MILSLHGIFHGFRFSVLVRGSVLKGSRVLLTIEWE